MTPAELAREVMDLRAQLAAMQQSMDEVRPFTDKIAARLAEAERDMDQLIGERDHAQGMADKLASALATLLGVEIGEHSNMNCPWENALEAFEDRPADSASEMHASDCAVHNEPALPAGPCNCGAAP